MIGDWFSEDDDYHEFAFVVVAQDHRAQQSRVGVFVIESEPVLSGIRAHAIADAVVDVRHQVALLDIQHFVKAVRDMKTEAINNW